MFIHDHGDGDNGSCVLIVLVALKCLSAQASKADLQHLVQDQVQKSSLTAHAVQDVQIAAQTLIGLGYPVKTSTLSPNRVRNSRVYSLSTTRTDLGCQVPQRPSLLVPRQVKDQRKAVSSGGPVIRNMTNWFNWFTLFLSRRRLFGFTLDVNSHVKEGTGSEPTSGLSQPSGLPESHSELLEHSEMGTLRCFVTAHGPLMRGPWCGYHLMPWKWCIGSQQSQKVSGFLSLCALQVDWSDWLVGLGWARYDKFPHLLVQPRLSADETTRAWGSS